MPREMPTRSASNQKTAPGNSTAIPARRRLAQRSVALVNRHSEEYLRLSAQPRKQKSGGTRFQADDNADVRESGARFSAAGEDGPGYSLTHEKEATFPETRRARWVTRDILEGRFATPVNAFFRGWIRVGQPGPETALRRTERCFCGLEKIQKQACRMKKKQPLPKTEPREMSSAEFLSGSLEHLRSLPPEAGPGVSLSPDLKPSFRQRPSVSKHSK